MPRLPKDFTVQRVELSDVAPIGVPISADAELPVSFLATVTTVEPPMAVTLNVKVQSGGQPIVRELRVTRPDGGPITTSTMRKVLVDQILSAAVAEAASPIERLEGYAYRSFLNPADPQGFVRNTGRPVAGRQERQDERAREAAAVYAEAVAADSKSPGVAVANAMGYSRSQAARYIRRARELGYLADASDEAVGETVDLPRTGLAAVTDSSEHFKDLPARIALAKQRLDETQDEDERRYLEGFISGGEVDLEEARREGEA